jgi:broad specificity phosphatase PhoE
MTVTTTTVWLARHGEAHNPNHVLYGRLPGVRLTAQGRKEAQALADFLAERPLAAVYSSPLLRARSTAEIILRQATATGMQRGRVRLDSDLQEVRTAWEGEPLEALERINWDFYANPRHRDDESLQMIYARMHRWLRRVLRRHAGGDVVGVSHGDPLLILIGGLRDLPLSPERIFPNPYITTGVLSEMRFDQTGTCLEVRLLDCLDREAAA